MRRLGSTSGLYQMFNELYDVYAYDRRDGCLRRYEEVPLGFLSELEERMGIRPDEQHVFTVRFTYGANFSSATRHIFASDRVALVPEIGSLGPFMTELPNGIEEGKFLHPILERHVPGEPASCDRSGQPVGRMPSSSSTSAFHMLEDVHTLWDRPIDALSLVDYFATRCCAPSTPPPGHSPQRPSCTCPPGTTPSLTWARARG